MNEDKKRLLHQVAYMYYVEGKNQTEISESLNIYRTTISRLIKRAKEEGIVEVRIKGFNSKIYELEGQLKEKFQLDFVRVIPNMDATTEKEKQERLAVGAGLYLKQIIEPNSVVGLTWGGTLKDCISSIDNKRTTNATFVPIVGGPSHVNSQYHINTLVYDLARKLGGNSIFVNAAAVQETKELKDGIMKSKYFEKLRDYWRNLDVAIVGIGGTLYDKASQWRDLLTPEDFEELKLREAIGDCCCRFFDKDGKILKGNLHNRIIGIELEELRNVPSVIGIARGKRKSKAILACLKNRFISSLITDEDTAAEIVRLVNVREAWRK